MQHNIAELRQELREVQEALVLPGVTPQMRTIFNSTIATIQRKIAEASQAPPAAAAAPPQKEARRLNMSGQPERQQPAPTTHAPRQPQPGSENMGVVTAMESGPIKKVKIKWHALETVELTEGETATRFRLVLRDLANLKPASEKRWNKVAESRQFARAVTYYKALMVFWPYRPTPKQLGLNQMSETKQIIFNMIEGEAILELS